MRIMRSHCYCCCVLCLRSMIFSRKPYCMKERLSLLKRFRPWSLKELKEKFDINVSSVGEDLLARWRASTSENRGCKRRSKLRTWNGERIPSMVSWARIQEMYHQLGRLLQGKLRWLISQKFQNVSLGVIMMVRRQTLRWSLGIIEASGFV